MRPTLHFISVALPASIVVSGAGAQTAANTPLLSLKGGYQRTFSDKSSDFYYDFAFLGNSIAQKGSSPTFSDLSAGGLADVTSRSVYLTFERDRTSAGGSLLKGYSTNSFEKLLDERAGFLKDFNLVLGTDAQLGRLSGTTYTYGVEYRPIPILAFLARPGRLPLASSFLTIGLAGQRDQSGGNGDSDRLALTLRGMVARQIYLRDASDREEREALREQTFQHVQDYQTVATIRTEYDKWVAGGKKYTVFPEDRRTLLKYLVIAYVELKDRVPKPSDADWREQIRDVQQFPVSVRAMPDLALWADANARESLTGHAPGGRWRLIYSLNAKYYLNPNQPKQLYVQAQYLGGYQEATPTKSSSGFIVMAGVQF